MTGRDLIIYILQNNLEDEVVLKDGIFVGYISDEEVAARFGVGVETVRVWYALGAIEGVRIGDSVYCLDNVKDPRKGEMQYER